MFVCFMSLQQPTGATNKFRTVDTRRLVGARRYWRDCRRQAGQGGPDPEQKEGVAPDLRSRLLVRLPDAYRRYAMVLRLKKEAFTVRLSRLYSARRAPCKHDEITDVIIKQVFSIHFIIIRNSLLYYLYGDFICYSSL